MFMCRPPVPRRGACEDGFPVELLLRLAHSVRADITRMGHRSTAADGVIPLASELENVIQRRRRLRNRSAAQGGHREALVVARAWVADRAWCGLLKDQQPGLRPGSQHQESYVPLISCVVKLQLLLPLQRPFTKAIVLATPAEQSQQHRLLPESTAGILICKRTLATPAEQLVLDLKSQLEIFFTSAAGISAGQTPTTVDGHGWPQSAHKDEQQNYLKEFTAGILICSSPGPSRPS